jgi:hypothetical protein
MNFGGMNLADIPLVAKLSAGGVATLALLGGGIAAGAHLAGATAAASVAAPVVASPTPSAAPATAAQSGAARAARRAEAQAEAQVLGISGTQLGTDLRSGQTVQQLAGAKGLSEDQFRGQLVQAVRPLLDQQVAAGALTAAQEQAALKRLDKTIPNWVRAPAKQPAPSPSPTP